VIQTSPHAEAALTCKLDERSLYLRRLVLSAVRSAGRGHVGPALSLIEMVRVLYDDVLRIDPKNPREPDRDRAILSKGHGCLALYVLLADRGFFPLSELEGFCGTDSILGGHPEYGMVPGVEASTGALGHGLSIGVGLALAARMRDRAYRTFVLLGDGEINEGWAQPSTGSTILLR
jgi:transketolase